MKIKMSRMSCGVATASLFAIALSACGDDSSSSPDYNETNSSAIEQTDLSSAGNDDILSSSDVPPTSSNSAYKVSIVTSKYLTQCKCCSRQGVFIN